MIVPVQFNPQAGMLWINIEMFGLYFITYTLQLWAANPHEPPVLTNPLKYGSNEVPHDDFHPIINDYNATEPLENYRNRIIDLRFWIKKGEADHGYDFRATIFQGSSFQSSTAIGSNQVIGTVGSLSIKEEFITIKLTN